VSPIDLGTGIAGFGLVVGVVGLGWTIVAFVRHRGALGAQRAFFVGLGIMTAAMPISLLAIPDRPAVISALALCLLLVPLLPFAIAAKLRVRNGK
jgi:hypothetical protein